MFNDSKNKSSIMEKISAKQFYVAWINAVNSRKKYLLEIQRQNKLFTKAIFNDEDPIVLKVAEALKLECYNQDYYSIDSCFYTQDDLVPNRPQNSYWLRNIRVAFEHENIFNDSLFEEVAHLSIINCDLRVLVTYPYDDGMSQLEKLHEIIKGNRLSNQYSEEESFMIIFGSETDFVWDGYIYKIDSWKKL